MTDAKTTFETKLLTNAYNAFLHAPLMDEPGRAPLSVLSALSRLGLDPWREAAELARMSPANANVRMAELLGQVPGYEATPEHEATVRLLVGLLPRTIAVTEVTRMWPKSFALALSPPFAAIGFALGCLLLIISLLATHGLNSTDTSRTGGAASASSPLPDRLRETTP